MDSKRNCSHAGDWASGIGVRMNKTMIVAITVVAIVVIVGAALYTISNQGQTPMAPSSNFTAVDAVENQLSFIEDSISIDNLIDNLDLGDILGSWE